MDLVVKLTGLMLCAASLIGSGCATSQILVRGQPKTMVLTLPDGSMSPVPATLEVSPRKAFLVRAEAIGYRTMTVDIRKLANQLGHREARRVLRDAGSEVTILLVPEHDAVSSERPEQQ